MKKIKTDICIVGTGFSGTFLASQLQGMSASILFVERGAFISRDRIEDNYLANPFRTGELPLEDNADLYKLMELIYDDPEFSYYEHVNSGSTDFHYSGRHAVGGNSLLWWGNALRKVPADFHTKSAYGFGVDWPISYDELEDYYYQAEVEMGVSGPPEDAFSPYRKKPFPLPPFRLPPGSIELNHILKGTGLVITPSHKARLPVDHGDRSACCGAGTCWLFCPADARYSCLTTHLKNLHQSPQVAILDKVTVSRLVQTDDRIREAIAFDREGNGIRIEAEIFILAANAIENARILLLSQFHYLETGFKSRSKAIGKYLTDQVGIRLPVNLPYNLYPGHEKTIQSTHSLSFYDGPFRERYSSIVVEVFLIESPFASSLITKNEHAQTLIISQIQKGYYGNELREQVLLNSLGNCTLHLEMEMMAEERNCVELHHSRKNQFGDPIAEFQFSIWDQEYLDRSRNFYFEQFKNIVKDAGGKVGAASLRNSFEHMLGTCRMGTNPYESVVDENLKSHDHKNLYIVGGSAFPTAGSTNPTLTIVALALRCGSYLRNHLQT